MKNDPSAQRGKRRGATLLLVLIVFLPSLLADERRATNTLTQSVSETEIADLSLQEVRKRLPSLADVRQRLSRKESPDTSLAEQLRDEKLLFQRFGALRGEQALHAIIRRYRDEETTRRFRERRAEHPISKADVSLEYFIVAAMSDALEGWMLVDAQQASETLLDLAIGTSYEVEDHSRTRILFKNESVVLQGDFSVIPARRLICRGVTAATESDPDLGLALLSRKELLIENMFYGSLLDSYVQGLRPNTDWQNVKRQLDELDIVKTPNRSMNDDVVASAVAKGWARTDLDPAMDWYLGHASQGDRSERAVVLLWHVASTKPNIEKQRQVCDWILANKRKEPDIDSVIKDLAKLYTGDEPGAYIQRLISLPAEAATREEVLAAFVEMKTWDGHRRHSTDSLHALINAAKLSSERASYWRSVINQNWKRRDQE